jgi:hypothetical protein
MVPRYREAVLVISRQILVIHDTLQTAPTATRILE